MLVKVHFLGFAGTKIISIQVVLVIYLFLFLKQLSFDELCSCTNAALQFISQRHRPLRGNTSKLLLAYMRTFPCKVRLLS